MKNWLRKWVPKRPQPRSLRPRTITLTLERLEQRDVPAFTFQGGPVLDHVEVQALYFGRTWASSTTYNPQVGYLEQYLQYLVASPYMDMLTRAGYTDAAGNLVGHGSFDSGPVLNVSPNNFLDAYGYLDDSTIRDQVQAQITSGTLKSPDANRLYIVFVQPNVAVYDDSSQTDSIRDFTGYHAAFAGTDVHGAAADIHYAVIPYPGGRVGNAGDPNLTRLGTITSTVAHEVAESVTDPDVGYTTEGWYDTANDLEIADGDNVLEGIVYLNGYALQKVADKSGNPIAPAQLAVSAQPLTVTANHLFSGVVGTGSDSVLATNPDGTFVTKGANLAATINWGDGTVSAGTVGDDGQGHFPISGSHTYQALGTFTVTVGIQDTTNSIAAASASGTATTIGTYLGGGIRSVSVAFDSSNRQVLDVVYANGDLYQGDATGTHFLGSGFQSVAIAFDHTNRFVLTYVDRAGNLVQGDVHGTHLLRSGVQSASLTFDAGNHQVLDYVDVAGNLVQGDATGAHFLGSGFVSVSATFDPANRFELDLVYAGGVLIQGDSTGSHYLGSGFTSVSASYDLTHRRFAGYVYSTGDAYLFFSS